MSFDSIPILIKASPNASWAAVTPPFVSGPCDSQFVGDLLEIALESLNRPHEIRLLLPWNAFYCVPADQLDRSQANSTILYACEEFVPDTAESLTILQRPSIGSKNADLPAVLLRKVISDPIIKTAKSMGITIRTVGPADAAMQFCDADDAPSEGHIQLSGNAILKWSVPSAAIDDTEQSTSPPVLRGIPPKQAYPCEVNPIDADRPTGSIKLLDHALIAAVILLSAITAINVANTSKARRHTAQLRKNNTASFHQLFPDEPTPPSILRRLEAESATAPSKNSADPMPMFFELCTQTLFRDTLDVQRLAVDKHTSTLRAFAQSSKTIDQLAKDLAELQNVGIVNTPTIRNTQRGDLDFSLTLQAAPKL